MTYIRISIYYGKSVCAIRMWAHSESAQKCTKVHFCALFSALNGGTTSRVIFFFQFKEARGLLSMVFRVR